MYRCLCCSTHRTRRRRQRTPLRLWRAGQLLGMATVAAASMGMVAPPGEVEDAVGEGKLQRGRAGGEGRGEGSDVREMYAYAPVRHSAGSLQFTLPNWAWQELKSTPAPAPWSQLAHWLKPPIEQPVAPQKSRATPSLSPNSALSGELRW